MSLLGLLVDSEAVFIVELDSVLMLLDDSTDDELFTGRAPPRWLLAVIDFIDDELTTSLLLDSTNGFTLELLMLELEVSFDEALLNDELFTLELFLLLFEILLELEISFDEALLDDKLLTFELLIVLDELMLELLCLLLEVEDEVDELSECGITSVEFIYVGSSVTVT